VRLPPVVITAIEPARETLVTLQDLPTTAGDRRAAVRSHRMALTAHRAQQYGDAETHWAAAARLDPSWDGPFYNLACIASLEGRVDDAIAYLDLATRRGLLWSRLRGLSTDPDLLAVRGHPRLSAIIAAETARLCALPGATAPECAR
jgi:hypothetical protein